MPASMRCMYNCEKSATGELDRGKMLRTLQEDAVKIPDKEDKVQFVLGTVRGKKVILVTEKLKEIIRKKFLFLVCA